MTNAFYPPQKDPVDSGMQSSSNVSVAPEIDIGSPRLSFGQWVLRERNCETLLKPSAADRNGVLDTEAIFITIQSLSVAYR